MTWGWIFGDEERKTGLKKEHGLLRNPRKGAVIITRFLGI